MAIANLVRSTVFVLSGVTLGACTHLPMVGGKPLPPLSQEGPVMYRDLADIPEAPPTSTPDSTSEATKALNTDRSETEKAAEDLEKQPFFMPAPATPDPGF